MNEPLFLFSFIRLLESFHVHLIFTNSKNSPNLFFNLSIVPELQ